tara:strand:+ start:106 stop:354 length:249 start_codon:yes stop_codon:yes gene_type:complete
MKLKQIGANQTELILADHYETQIFFSYETAVCIRNADGCFVTTEKYSRTTSKHINNWVANLSNIIKMVPQSELDKLVEGVSI